MSIASPLEQLMLDLINTERAAAGVAPLTFDDKLNDSSEAHSQWMLNTDRFSHTGMGGSTPQQRMEAAGFKFEGNTRSGENIGFQSERGAPGLADDVRQIHDSLMNSPGHRANILNPDFKEIGIGIERGDFTQGGTFDSVMVTQNFARTDAVDDPAPAPQVPTPPDVVATPDTPVTPETPADPDVVAGPDTDEPQTDPDVVEGPDAQTPDTPQTPETPVEVAECDAPDGEEMPVTEVGMDLPDEAAEGDQPDASDEDGSNGEDVVVDASAGEDDDAEGDDAEADDAVGDDAEAENAAGEDAAGDEPDDVVAAAETEDDSDTDTGTDTDTDTDTGTEDSDMADLGDMPDLDDLMQAWGCGNKRPGYDDEASQQEASASEDAAGQGQMAKNYIDFGGFRIFFEPLDGAGGKPGSEPSRWMSAEDQQFGSHCGGNDVEASNSGALDFQGLPADLSEFFGHCGGQQDNWLNFA